MSEQQPPAAGQPHGAHPQHPYPQNAYDPYAHNPYPQDPYAQNPYPQDFTAHAPSYAPGYPAGPAQPPGDAWGQHPSPPPAQKSHVGLIIGSIVGGVLLLGLTFAGGAAVGWWLGAHHASSSGFVMMDPGSQDGQLPPGWRDRGQDDQNDAPGS